MIDKLINKALNSDICINEPIENFSINDLKELSKKARNKNILIFITNGYNDTFNKTYISLIPRDNAYEVISYI